MSVGTSKQRASDYFLPVGKRVSVLLVGGGNIVGELDDAVFDDEQIVALLVRQGDPASAQTLVTWQAVLTVDVGEDYLDHDPVR
jgi:hypothetical protein